MTNKEISEKIILFYLFYFLAYLMCLYEFGNCNAIAILIVYRYKLEALSVLLSLLCEA